MASSSVPRPAAGSSRMATTAATISSDYHSLIAVREASHLRALNPRETHPDPGALNPNPSLFVYTKEIRKTVGMIKSVAVNLERDKKFDEVKELDDAVLEIIKASDECSYFSLAIQSVAGGYQLGEQPTNFGKLLDDEVNKLKVESPPDPQANSFYRQFKEAVWNVHHAGQPMPGEEQEEIVMTSTQSCLLNTTCPLTGKLVIELKEPVRREGTIGGTPGADATRGGTSGAHATGGSTNRGWYPRCQATRESVTRARPPPRELPQQTGRDWGSSLDCKHIYEKAVVLQYIKQKAPHSHCPAAGCPRILQVDRVVCDPLLPIEIDEMRSRGSEMVHSTVVEDFTELGDD
ncbi:hypothetical protein Taro_036380 [Colocasia esculenta]|uniref:SP-RING-type domain-containing protein n=1 Tax=Colocasia esculenta TaxID=4460 RepID=A0A843W6M4_COLES|nr:hypothetical protein [Colocasia esculenta]